MVEKKTHKFLIAWISVIAIFLLLVASLFAFAGPVQETAYFNSKELGIVETKVTIYHWYNKWMRVFQQAVVFAEEEVTLGSQVSVTDFYTMPDTPTCFLSAVDIFVIPPSGGQEYIGGDNFADNPLQHWAIFTEASFPANEVGTFSGVTDYYFVECDLFDCFSSILCLMHSEPSDNTVTVTDSTPPICEKDPYWSDWTQDTEIDNGDIQKRIHYSVDSSCDFYDDNVGYQTLCDLGYKITGTDSSTIGAGQLTCELMPVVNECETDANCTGQICVSGDCVNYECDTSITITCNDNSTIVTYNCVNYRLVATGNVCPVVIPCTTDATKCIGTNYTLCVNGIWVDQGLVEGECGYNEPIVGGCGTVTPGLEDECCQNLGYDYWSTIDLVCKSYDDIIEVDEFNWLLTLLIVGIIVVGGVVIIITVKYIRRKK